MAADAEIARLIASIQMENAQFLAACTASIEQMKMLTATVDQGSKKVQKSTADMGASFGHVIDNLGTKMSNMVGQMRAMAAIESPFGFAKEGIRLAADAESMQVSFETMLKSASKARMMMEDLTKFAAETPLTMPGITSTTKQLLQFGVDQERIIPLMRMLGDAASGEQDKLSRLALAYGQAKSAGRLMGEEIAQMREAGFNPLQEISRTTGKSMAELTADVEAGRITMKMLDDALKSATSAGGMFADGMLKQSKTAKGLWSTMTDDIDAAKRKLGELLTEQLYLKDAIKLTSDAAQGFTSWLNDAGKETKLLITFSGVLVASIGSLAMAWKVGAIAVGMMVGVAKDFIGTIAWVVRGIKAYITAVNLATTAQWLWNAAVTAFPLILAAGALATVANLVSNLRKEANELKVMWEEVNAEIARSKKLGEVGGAAKDVRFEKKMAAFGDIADPEERLKALKAEQELMDKNTASIEGNLARVKAAWDDEHFSVKRVMASDAAAFVGIGEETRAMREMTERDLDDATKALERHKAELKRVAEAKAAAEVEISRSDAVTLKGIKDVTEKLTMERITYGMASEEAEIFKARMVAGADAATVAALAKAEDALAARDVAKKIADANKELKDYIKSTREEIATTGMSAEGKKLHKMAVEGASAAMLDEARRLAFVKEGLDKHNEMYKEGADILKKYMTPQQKMQEETNKLSDLLNAGIFSQDQYSFALTKVQEEYAKTAEEADAAKAAIQGVDAALSGSAEAQMRVAAYTEALADSGAKSAKSQYLTQGPSPLLAAKDTGQQAVIDVLNIIATHLGTIKDKPELVVMPAGVK